MGIRFGSLTRGRAAISSPLKSPPTSPPCTSPCTSPPCTSSPTSPTGPLNGGRIPTPTDLFNSRCRNPTNSSAPPVSNSALAAFAYGKDTLSEIFSRLPVRPLIRLQSVCKNWMELIADPHLAVMQSRRNPRPSCTAILWQQTLSSPLDFIPIHHNFSYLLPGLRKFDIDPFRILQSSKGLVLLELLDPVEIRHFVWNPTIDSWSGISAPSGKEVLGMNLVHDVERWSGGFKCVCVWKCWDGIRQGIDVYHQQERKWIHKLEFRPDSLPEDCDFYKGVYCNGNLYWLSHTSTSAFYDVEKERISFLSMPLLEGEYRERFNYFGESNNQLHLVESQQRTLAECKVLALQKDKCNWVVKFLVNLNAIADEFPEVIDDFSISGCQISYKFYGYSILHVECENPEEAMVVLWIPGNVISYNFTTGKCCQLKNLKSEGESDSQWPSQWPGHVFPMVESLYDVTS